MCSIDITGSTSALLETLRGETGWSNDHLISEALKAFQAKGHRTSKTRKAEHTATNGPGRRARNTGKPSPELAAKTSPGDNSGVVKQQKLTPHKRQKPKDSRRVQADLFGD